MKTIAEILKEHDAYTPELVTALQEHCADFIMVFVQGLSDATKGDMRKLKAIMDMIHDKPAEGGEGR